MHELQLLVRVRVWGWVRVMVEFWTSSAFWGWVRVRVLGYGFARGVRGRKVKSRDCALASDLVRADSKIQRIVDVHRPRRMISVYRSRLERTKKRKLRAARGSGITDHRDKHRPSNILHCTCSFIGNANVANANVAHAKRFKVKS